MLTLPTIVERPAQPYIAIREQVTMPFGDVIDRVLPELMAGAEGLGHADPGPVFFKFNRVRMPELEVEFGVPTAALLPATGRLVSGTIPAGRYATLTYWGHYENLIEVTGLLLAWAANKGLRWDMRATPEGDEFAARLETYITDPAEEPDPRKWETVLAFKLADD